MDDLHAVLVALFVNWCELASSLSPFASMWQVSPGDLLFDPGMLRARMCSFVRMYGGPPSVIGPHARTHTRATLLYSLLFGVGSHCRHASEESTALLCTVGNREAGGVQWGFHPIPPIPPQPIPPHPNPSPTPPHLNPIPHTTPPHPKSPSHLISSRIPAQPRPTQPSPARRSLA